MFENARARKLFDSGVLALGFPVSGRRGPVNIDAARTNFGQALEIDPEMCDAWLGLAATGVVDPTVIANLFRTAPVTLFREQIRLGLRPGTLAGRFDTGLYVTSPLSDGNEIWVAAAVAHMKSKQYDAALAILGTVDGAFATATYVRGVTYYETRRWPQVLESLNGSESWKDPYLRCGANAMSGRACAHLGLYDEADRRLRQAEHRPIDDAVQSARHIRGLIARARGDEGQARALFERVYAARPGWRDNAEALADPKYHLLIETAEQISRRRDPWDPSSAPSETDRLEQERRDRGEAAVAESRRLLDEMTGLASVKREVEKLMATTMLARHDAGAVTTAAKSRHLVFTGPPGVGKTQVARILAKMYYGLGILESDSVVEVAPNDFFGPGYGGAEERSREIFERAMGGVLFIDEAYSLYQDGIIGGDAAGSKVIDALLATMENNRDRLVVIVAGYEDAMNTFLERNAGLKSRFSKQIRFPSYAPDELVEIAGGMARSTYGAELSDAAGAEVVRVVTHLCATTETAPNGDTRVLIDREGNARFVRNLLEGAIEERDLRLVSGAADIRVLSPTQRALIEREDVVRVVTERYPELSADVV